MSITDFKEALMKIQMIFLFEICLSKKHPRSNHIPNSFRVYGIADPAERRYVKDEQKEANRSQKANAWERGSAAFSALLTLPDIFSVHDNTPETQKIPSLATLLFETPCFDRLPKSDAVAPCNRVAHYKSC